MQDNEAVSTTSNHIIKFLSKLLYKLLTLLGTDMDFIASSQNETIKLKHGILNENNYKEKNITVINMYLTKSQSDHELKKPCICNKICFLIFLFPPTEWG